MKFKSYKSKKDILNGNIAEQLMLITIPVCGTYLLQQLYQFVDSIVLGRYAGVEAMAAVGGSATMLINVLLNIIVGIATGSMVIVAQSYGRGNYDGVKDAVKTGMFIAIVFGGVISVISAIVAKPLLIFMNCPEETIPLSLIYLYSYFLGIIPYAIYQFGNYILRATGDTKISMLFTIIIAVTKIVFDLLLTAVLNLGVWGVAISTFLSYLICGATVLVILHKTANSYQYTITDFGFDKEILKETFKIGVPVAIQSSVFAITNALVSVKVNEFGTNSIAAYSVYNNIDNFYWSFDNAIGSAMVTVAGQNYGNKNMKRVKETFLYGNIILLAATVIISSIVYISAESLASIFTTDINVVNISARMVHFIVFSYFAYLFVETVSSTIKGCGDSMNSMIIAVIGICGVRFIYLLLFKFTDVLQVLYCYPMSWAVTSIIYIIYYLLNKKYH